MSFFGFLLSSFILAKSVYNFINFYSVIESFANKNVIFIMLFLLFSAITSALLLSLLILQFYLIGKNVLTSEYLKKTYDKDNPNPFNEGFIENLKIFSTRKVNEKQISLSYLLKKHELEIKRKKSSDVEVGNNCDIFRNCSHDKEIHQEEKKIEENLLRA